MSKDDYKKQFSLQERPATKKDAEKVRRLKEKAKEKGIPWRVYRNRCKYQRVYYVQFKDDDGEYMTARSTGQSTRGAAEAWAIKQLREGKITTKGNMTLSKYAENWYIPGKCRYMKRLEAEGNPVGHSYAKISRGYLDNHILPALGHKKLSSITKRHIEDLKMALRDKGLSPTSVNHVLSTLNVILREAAENEVIPRNPAANVRRLRGGGKEKGILQLEEVRDLFSSENYSKAWGEDILHYTLNYLAAWSGMRMGEIQGLQIKNVFPQYVHVCAAWERRYGLKSTKTGQERTLPYLKEDLYELLQDLIALQRDRSPEALVFQGRSGQLPVDHKAITGHLYKALEGIGIDPETRKERNVTFHSWRHFLNTTLRASGAPDWMVRLYTGHTTAAMTENYSHFQLEHMAGYVQQFINGGAPEGTD